MLSEKDIKFIKNVKKGRRFLLALGTIVIIFGIFWIFFVDAKLDSVDFIQRMRKVEEKFRNVQPRTELEISLKEAALTSIGLDKRFYLLFEIAVILCFTLPCFLWGMFFFTSYFIYGKFLSIIEKASKD